MGMFKSLKAMTAAMAAGYRGEGPSAEALAALTPEQRAAYEAQLAASGAAVTVASVEADERVARRPLAGPAGEWVYGASSGALSTEQLASMSAAEQMQHTMEVSQAQFRDLLRNPLGGGSSPPPPPPPVPGASPDRAVQAAAERALRDEARAPYRAPNIGPIAFTRLATRAKTQVDEVCEYLGSSGLSGRPDLVFGAYRVPDVIGLGTIGKGAKVVEWDIVHGAVDALPAAPAATSTWFRGEDTWAARSIGQPSVLDEDLAIALLATAGAGPERSLGIARQLDVSSRGGDESGGSTTVLRVTGVQVLHPADVPAPQALEHLDGLGPLDLPLDGPPGVRVEVLNWAAIASAVHPAHHKAVPIPSPFPYLPSTPQELLRAYLEVVGVHPTHCYSVQVTEDGPRSIDGRGTKGGFTFSTNVGEEQPCADGTLRRRLNGGTVVVVAYLDAEAYAAGRERWAAYERDVLQARLHQGTGARRPVEEPPFDGLPGGIRTLARVADKVDTILDGAGPLDAFAPHRYCWPPQDAR